MLYLFCGYGMISAHNSFTELYKIINFYSSKSYCSVLHSSIVLKQLKENIYTKSTDHDFIKIVTLVFPLLQVKKENNTKAKSVNKYVL